MGQQHQDDLAETQQPASYHGNHVQLSAEGPRAFDVLFGRGRGPQEHPGNVVLQEIVKLHRSRYQRARRKYRNGIAQEIVQNMKYGGSERQQRHVRFLKRLGKGSIDDCWVEVSDKDAAQKVCHALRIRPVSNKQGVGINEVNDSDSFPSYDVYSPDNNQSYDQMRFNQQQYHQVGQIMPSDLSLEIVATMDERFNRFQQQQEQVWRPQGEAYPSPMNTAEFPSYDGYSPHNKNTQSYRQQSVNKQQRQQSQEVNAMGPIRFRLD
jgi:hypothetical protein